MWISTNFYKWLSVFILNCEHLTIDSGTIITLNYDIPLITEILSIHRVSHIIFKSVNLEPVYVNTPYVKVSHRYQQRKN